jgi:hypothetical protein
MYGFVENWIPQLLGMQCEPYYLSEDVSCSIVSKEDFIKIKKCMTEISNQEHCQFHPLSIRSNVTGMAILLMKYWIDETVFYSLTDGDIKRSEPFVWFMKIAHPRFDFEFVKTKLRQIYEVINSDSEIEIENLEHTDEEEQTVDIIGPEEPQAIIVNKVSETDKKFAEELITILEEKKPEIKNKAGDEFIDKIKSIFGMYDTTLFITEKGNKVLVTTDTPKTINNMIIKFADSINKNVIFTKYYYPKIYNFLKKLDPIEIYKHTVVFDLQPNQSNNISQFINRTREGRGINYTNTICLGEKLLAHYIVKGSNVNEEINEINIDITLTKDQKANKIKEIIDKKINSPFFQYDCIFKDTYTNTIFALKQRCIIYLLFYFHNEQIELLEKCLIEIARRINMDIPYETLLEIDKGYFDKLESNNLEDYVKFAVESSKGTYNEIVSQLNSEKERFKKYMDLAMESAKKIKNFQELIESFNMGSFEEKQKEKARMTFLDTIKIREVSTIYIEGESIHVFTKNIYAKDDRTKKWHDIGTFHIIIGMLSSTYDQNNTVRIFNTKHLGMGMNNGFQAPHVWEDGHACHGNLAIGMTEAYKNRNLFDLVYQIIIFLQSANTSDSAGQHVDSWPEVTEEEALGKIESRDITFIYNKKDDVEEKYDNMLAEALPIKITR